MAQETPIIQSVAPEKGRGLALRNVYGSVIAGVGEMIPKQQEVLRPELKDYRDEEAFRKYKEFNTNTNLRVNEKVMWGNTLEKVAGYILSGMALAIGAMLLEGAKATGASWGLTTAMSSTLAGVLGVGALVAVSLGVFYTFSQVASREQSDKFMDVDDFRMKRSAGLIAQEIKKALTEDGVDLKGQSHSHTREVIVVQQAANENNAPKTMLSAQASERELNAKIAVRSAQSEIA